MFGAVLMGGPFCPASHQTRNSYSEPPEMLFGQCRTAATVSAPGKSSACECASPKFFRRQIHVPYIPQTKPGNGKNTMKGAPSGLLPPTASLVEKKPPPVRYLLSLFRFLFRVGIPCSSDPVRTGHQSTNFGYRKAPAGGQRLSSPRVTVRNGFRQFCCCGARHRAFLLRPSARHGNQDAQR